MKYRKDKNDGYTIRTISPGSWGHNDPPSGMLNPIIGRVISEQVPKPCYVSGLYHPSKSLASPSDTSFFVHTLPIRLFVQHDAKPSFHRWGCTGVVGNMKAIQITYYVIGV
jgi:hypothetical protein